MKSENREPGLGSEFGTECGGMPAAAQGSDLHQAAGMEPAGMERAGMEPAGAEPAGTEPASMESAGMEPAGMEPARAAAAAKDPSGGNFAEASVSAGFEQKLKVAVDAGSGAQIATLSAFAEEISEGATAAQKEQSATAERISATTAEQGMATTARNEQAATAEQTSATNDEHETGDFNFACKTEFSPPPVSRWVPGFDRGLTGSSSFKTSDSRSRQLFNAFYFALAGISAISLVSIYSLQLPASLMAWVMPVGLGLWALFFALALSACFFAIHNRPHESDFKVDLLPHVRRRIRRIGLLIPLPVILLAGCVNLSQHELAVAQHRIDDGHYRRAIRHLNLAMMLNPLSEKAYAQMSWCQNRMYAYPQALHFADLALRLNPEDGRVMTGKAWALNGMERFQEALVAASSAVQLDPNNGEAFASLTDAYVGTGDYDAALIAAIRHAQLHSREAAAYERLADINEKLGRLDEASVNRDQADALRSGETEE